MWELFRVVANLWWTTLYICLWWMIIGQVMVIYLTYSLVLIYTCDGECWMAMCCFKFLLWNLGHQTLFHLCEITWHITFLFTDIYLFTHTCCTPQIAKFWGSIYLDVCKSCIDDSNWNSNSCIYQGGALHKFWGSKALSSFILIKA